MKNPRMFQKTPVPCTVAKEIPVRSKGRFTGEKIVVAVDNPDYHPATMDNVVCPQGAYPNTGWRGMKGHKNPSVNGNTYVGRQRSGRIKRNFGNEGKVAQVQSNAAAFASASPARQTVMALRLKAIGPEDDFLGVAAREELERRKREQWEEMMA